MEYSVSTLKTNTIQAATGSTVNVASGQVFTAPGHVIQVVQTFKDDVFNTTSTSYVDVTGLAASITPSSTSSKILVQLRTSQAMSSSDKMYTSLLRGSTAIAVANGKDYFSGMYPSRQGGTDGVSYIAHGSTHLDFLDTPSTTSSTTYKVQMKVNAGGAYLNRGRDNDEFRGVSSITLLEIAQ